MSTRAEITTVFHIVAVAGEDPVSALEPRPYPSPVVERPAVAERPAAAYGGPVVAGRPASPGPTGPEATQREHRGSVAGRRASPEGANRERRYVQRMERLRACLAAQNLDGREEEVLMVSGADRATLETAKALVDLLSERLCDLQEADMPGLIEMAMPMVSERTPASVIYHARRNAGLRAEFIRTYELLDAEQVHALYGSSAKNRAALAARWRSDRKIFAIEHRGRLLYPAFQFDELGRPRAAIGRILKALGPATGPWQTAIWFTTPNSWLDRRKPVDLLERDPDLVIDAADDVSNPAFY